jgi:hypothetical protein
MSYQVPDPNSLTIPKLKSVLTQHGFGDQLPAHQEKKGFYVDLYRKHIVPLLEARNAASQSLTPGPPTSTSAASAKERTTKTDLVDRRRTIHCTPLFLLSLHVGHLGKLIHPINAINANAMVLVHTALAPEPTEAAPTKLTQTKLVAKAKAAPTGPTTPAAKGAARFESIFLLPVAYSSSSSLRTADAEPAAVMPRRLFAPEQQPTTGTQATTAPLH